MSKLCPITKELVLYTECLECEEKMCKDINVNELQKENKEPVSKTTLEKQKFLKINEIKEN